MAGIVTQYQLILEEVSVKVDTDRGLAQACFGEWFVLLLLPECHVPLKQSICPI